jgi:hypothetical protein
VRYVLGSTGAPVAVAMYTYDTLPAAERAALPSDADVVAALARPLEVGGRQLSLTEFLTNRGPAKE